MTREDVLSAMDTIIDGCNDSNVVCIFTDISDAVTGEDEFDSLVAIGQILGSALASRPENEAHLMIAVCASIAVKVQLANRKRMSS